MENTLISPQGQLLIPMRLRQKYGMQAGTRVLLEETDKGVLIKSLDENFFKSFMGILAHGDVAKDMQAMKAEELQLEDKQHNPSAKPKRKIK